MRTDRLPSFFISHGGGPCFWVNWDPPDMFKQLEKSLQSIPALVGTRPKAILVISAHWEEDQFTIQTTPQPELIYDYHGFPPHTYKLKYPAQTSRELISRLKELLSDAGIDFNLDNTRGYDHGVFVPLLKIYPLADIPVVQLSIKKDYDPDSHYQLGKALAPLRKEGVLIIGSGLSYHNLRDLKDTNQVSEKFDEWLTHALNLPEEGRHQELLRWVTAPGARQSHPKEDHFLPLIVLAGTAEQDKAFKFYSEKLKNWTFKSASFQFGETFHEND